MKSVTAKKWLGRATRQVVVPSWLAILMLLVAGYSIIDLFARHPRYVFVALAAGILFSALIVKPLRKATGQEQNLDPDYELEAIWRRLRTWNLWVLVILLVLDCGIILDATGLVILP